MRLLLIFGSIFILSIHAAAQTEIFTVEYAKVAGNTLSLCGIEETVKPDGDKKSATAELTIENEENGVVEVKNLKGTFSDDSSSIEFTYDANDGLNGNTYAIYTKVTVTTITDPLKETTATEYEFSGTFTFTETNAENVGFKFYKSINIIQFTNGNVPVFKVIEGSKTIIEQTPITCTGGSELCIHLHSADLNTLAENQKVEIYNAEGDTIPISSPKEISQGDIIDICTKDVVDSVVYDNDESGPKVYEFKMADGNGPAPCAVDGKVVKYDILTNKPQAASKFTIIYNNKCEEIETPVRPMTFLDPFSKTVEVSWAKDALQYYLEVSGTLTKNLHIDCSGIGDLGTCIAYVFDDNMPTDKDLTYQLSAASGAPDIKAYSAGKSKTKQTYKHKEPTSGDQNSLKTLNLNQFEINWNTKQGKLCVEDALYEKNKKSQFRYELVIGFDDGNWKKHIANYNDESTICFNDFEITQLIENKLGVHFLVMKRGSDTNQIVASDMITTDLIVPEISEVNDETISLEFENLNSPFLIRDEKTKNIISKNEKKIHNLAFLKSSHENKSLFNRNLVLETRKEHTQMKVHFKIPQKVNAA